MKPSNTMSNWGIPCEVREVTHQEFYFKDITKIEKQEMEHMKNVDRFLSPVVSVNEATKAKRERERERHGFRSKIGPQFNKKGSVTSRSIVGN